MAEVLQRQGNRATKKVGTWLWDTVLIVSAMCVLIIALVFSAIEVGVGWVAKKLFALTERIK